MAEVLDDYSIDLAFVPSDGICGICPKLMIRNMSGKDFISVDENTILYNMGIYVNIYYSKNKRFGEAAFRRIYTGSTVFPPMPPGNRKFIQIDGQHEFDLCGHMEMFARIMQPKIVDAVVLKKKKIDYMEIQFVFGNLFELSNYPKAASIKFYSNEYKLEGKMLDRLITSLTAQAEQ